MQNTISDMARYIKNIIPPNIPETYTLKAMFKHVSGEENIRNGILAFRDLLYLVCDRLIADSSLDLCQYFGHKKWNIFSLHDINT